MGRTAPHIGMAVESLVTWPGKPEGEAPLEPNHSHLVLVEGENWGDETETMYALAAELGKNCPSVAVFAGGGEIAIKEMLANVAQSRPMILLAGSGRASDAVLAALDGHRPHDPRIDEIARLGGVIRYSISETGEPFSEFVRHVLS